MTLAGLQYLVTATLAALLSVFVVARRPPAPLWPALLVLLLSGLTFSLGDLAFELTDDPFWAQVWLSVVFTGVIVLALGWWFVSIGFVESAGLLDLVPDVRWERAALATGAAIWLLMITNGLHGQFNTPQIGVRSVFRWGFWLHAAFSYGLILSSVVLLARAWRRTPSGRRRNQIGLLTAAPAIVMTINSIYVFHPESLTVDPTVGALGIALALFVYGIYRTQLFDLAPDAVSQMVFHSPDGVLVTDRSGRIRFANPVAIEILGAEATEAGRDVAEAIERLMAPSAHHAGAGEAPPVRTLVESDIGIEAPFRSTDVDRYWTVRFDPVHAHRDRVVARCITIRDETERVLAASRARQAERLSAVGMLAAGVAHQINNPIAAILTGAELALSAEGHSDERGTWRGALEDHVEQARRCGRIVHSLLQFSRSQETARWEEDLNQVVRRAVHASRDYAGRNGVDLDLDVDDEALPAVLSPIEIEQVLVNLIRNAIEACDGHGRVVARSRGTAHSLEVEVEDSGCGIAERNLPRVLDPFFSTRTREGGTGLGLSVAHGIVESHGGDMTIESVAGRGTVVRVTLPRTKDAAPLASP